MIDNVESTFLTRYSGLSMTLDLTERPDLNRRGAVEFPPVSFYFMLVSPKKGTHKSMREALQPCDSLLHDRHFDAHGLFTSSHGSRHRISPEVCSISL